MLKNEDSYSGVLDGFREVERDGMRRWGETLPTFIPLPSTPSRPPIN